MSSFTIGEVAKQAGVNVETVRFYERQGVIDQPPQPDSGYRQYSAELVDRILFIKHAQGLGFSLKEIQELLSLQLGKNATCQDIRQRAEAKLDDVEAKIGSLKRIKKELVKLIEACSGAGPTSNCPILSSIKNESGRRSL